MTDRLDVDFVRQETDSLKSLAKQLVRDASEAEDLVQETWLAALKEDSRSSESAAPVPSRSWLRRVLRNLAYLGFRRRERRVRRESEVARPEIAWSGVEDSLQRIELVRSLIDSVAKLDEESRRVVVMRYFDGFTAAQIAELTEEKPSTIRMRLKRALDRLRSELDAVHGARRLWLVGLAAFAVSEPAIAGVGVSAKSGSVGGAKAAALAAALAATFALGWLGGAAGDGSLVSPSGWGAPDSEPAVQALEERLDVIHARIESAREALEFFEGENRRLAAGELTSEPFHDSV